MTALGDNLRCTATIATGDALDVREAVVHERLSSLFSVRLTVVCDNPDVDFEAAIGQAAGFTLQSVVGQERHRSWTGICRQLDQLRVDDGGLSTYSLELVPVLWLATQRRNHRMFQGLSDVDVALTLLAEWGISPVTQLSATYKKRKYRVQYGESDHDFVCRVLEDAGVTFWFEDRDGTTALVLSDTPHASPPRDPKIPYSETPTFADREHVTGVRVRREVRPGKVTLRDHDYRRQPSYKLLGAAALGSGVEDQLEQFHYTPGAFLFESDKGDPTPAADDHGRYRTDEGEAQAMARRRLDASRSEALSCTFDTNALDLAPGVVLSMVGHPRRDLGEDRRLLVVASTMTFTEAARLGHHCEAHRADVAYRPPLVTAKPRVMGVESATVVGPAGDEIHTDEFGRVRVHFHWDRESQMNEKSSCWIHVSQPWGGTGYGSVSLPRIGQEVLVDFLGGDPDRPIITGRVYTNLQKVPYPLPDNKTQSGWRSNSTNQTGGYNEMMFEDAAGQELLRMQAEKDMHKLVKNDEESHVGRDRARSVQRDESVSVGNDRTKQVQKTERVSIGQNHNIAVGVNHTHQVGNNHTTIVGVQHLVMISPPGEAFETSDASSTMTSKKIVLDTGGGARIEMEKDVIRIIADDLVEIWGKKRGVNLHAPAKGGKTNVFSGDDFTVDCKNVSITASDQLKILGKDVDIIGTDTAHLTGANEVDITGNIIEIDGNVIGIDGKGSVDVASKGAIDITGATVHVEGTPIKLNC